MPRLKEEKTIKALKTIGFKCDCCRSEFKINESESTQDVPEGWHEFSVSTKYDYEDGSTYFIVCSVGCYKFLMLEHIEEDENIIIDIDGMNVSFAKVLLYQLPTPPNPKLTVY